MTDKIITQEELFKNMDEFAIEMKRIDKSKLSNEKKQKLKELLEPFHAYIKEKLDKGDTDE